MNNQTRELDINIGDSNERLEELDAAMDLASDQDQRTVITAGGKRIAAVVTAEDLTRLEALDMTDRLAELIHTLGIFCDAAGMAGRSPETIARWLRTGE